MYELEARRQVEQCQTEVDDNNDHIIFINKLLKLSNILTALIYFLFAFALWVGDFWNIQSLVNDFFSGSVGIIVYTVVAVLMAIVLAGTKHASYNHFAKFPTARIFLAVMVATGIAAESFTSSSVQDVKARATANQNTEYNALTNQEAGSGIAASSQLASQIAHAQKVLERCKYDEARGKEKHCRGDQGKLDALLASQQAELNAQVMASNAQQQIKHDRIDQLKAEGYNPWIRSISSAFSMEMAAAIAIMMLLFSIVFECMHYFLSVMKRQALAARRELNQLLTNALIAFYEATGQEYPGDPDVVSSPIESPLKVGEFPSDDPDENRKRWGMSPAMASGIQENEKTNIEPTRTTAEATPEPEKQASHIDGFGFSGKLIQPKNDLKAYSAGGISGAVALQSSGVSGEPNTPNTQALSMGSTVEHASPKHAEPAEEYPRVASAPTQNTQETRKPETHNQNDLYAAWVAGIAAGEFRPVAKESRRFIQQKISGDQRQKKSMTIKQCGTMSKIFMKKGYRDGLLIKHPEPAQNKPDYILNPEYQHGK